MSTYTKAPCCAEPAFDLSRWLWDMWELPAVVSWLESSRSQRQCQFRMRIAMDWFKSSLWWAMSQSLYSGQVLGPLTADSFDTEEFCWAGVAPTAESERQILEFAADVARGYTQESDASPEHLRGLLMSQWVASRPVHDLNRYLQSERLLGEDAANMRLQG